MTNHTDAATEPLRKVAQVPQSPADAFRLFTDGISRWWPLATHSVGGDRATSVELEGAVGGHIVEHVADGSTAVWGTVVAWDPPDGLRFTWHPGTDPAEATEVEVRFVATGDGTRVELIHRGWDRRSDGAAVRANYDDGWDFVFGRYATLADGALAAAD